MKELFDFIFVRLYYYLFVHPRPAAKAASEWDIDLPGMKAVYRGPSYSQEQSPLAGITMTFYMAADGEGGKTLCGGLGTIPAEAQTALDTMNTHRQKQFLRRLIEEGDRVFRAAWEQSIKNNKKGKAFPRASKPTAFPLPPFSWGLYPQTPIVGKKPLCGFSKSLTFASRRICPK